MKGVSGNRRKYLRISTVLPVEFHVVDDFGKNQTPYLQGFTNNISKQGICLVVNDLWWGFADRLKSNVRLALQIEVPFKKEGMFTYARVAWQEKINRPRFVQYRIGVEFEEGKIKSTLSLFKYALLKKFLPFVVGFAVSMLILMTFTSWLKEQKTIKANKLVLTEYENILEESLVLKKSIDREKENYNLLQGEQNSLIKGISGLEKELAYWQKRYEGSLDDGLESDAKARDLKEKIVELTKNIGFLEKENSSLKEKINQSRKTQDILRVAFKEREKTTRQRGKKIFEGMYSWIKNRQDLKRGLVLSYEGDRNLDKVAFTYDQSLATIVFVIFNDFERAENILGFYLDKIMANQPIYNAYYTNGDVFEYAIYSGVNAWVGLAALVYEKATGDDRYFSLAEKVGDFLITMMDKDGGIIGGPTVTWYSTEHNLDSFAFFKLFHELGGKEKYSQASRRIKRWLDDYAYTDKEVPVNRGKGDATIATDTYSWSITALGPEILLLLDMDPDEILDFAVKNCEVETTFARGDTNIKVKGFDFAKFRNLARGGVISGEWSSQMILAFEIMADYYRDKDSVRYKSYLDKALLYASELQKMIISSPSPSGKANPTLPYASHANVDTGHGWRTPRGNRTGSLASTAYFLIAYRGFNPLQGEFLALSLKDIYENRAYED